MDHLLNLLNLVLLLWSSGLGAEDQVEPIESLRLVGGAKRCSGAVEVNHEGQWKQVDTSEWSMETAAALCHRLDCGSVVSVEQRKESSFRPVLRITATCIQSGSALKDCGTSRYSYHHMELTCSDSVRLLNGSSLCSGRLEVHSDRSWSSMCEADFDLQDAEVVCRELGCGPPSILQGALYGDLQAPMWSPEFQCGGHESALQDCRRSGSGRTSCSPGKAVGLTCSDSGSDLRLVGGASRCAGTLELKHLGTWGPAYVFSWTLKTAAVFCQHLDCGSPLHVEQVDESAEKPVWWINSKCVRSGLAPSDCATSENSSQSLKLNCSDSVRLLNGSSLCSGRLEVHSDRSWSSMCEADFDLQDAEVVCRELGCGPPSILQGALYGDLQAPMWSPEFQCGGHESALQDCRRSGSGRTSCSPGKAVGLTCSEPLRLVGGASRCAGTLEVKHRGAWRLAHVPSWSLQVAPAFCELLHCGSAVTVDRSYDASEKPAWRVSTPGVQGGADLRDSVTPRTTLSTLTLTCSERQ